MYTEPKISERIEKLRKEYKTCPLITENRPKYYSGDRWMSLGFLEGWLNNERAVTTRLRRSLSEAAELDAMKPTVYGNELVTGHLWFPKYTVEEQKRFDTLYEQYHMATATAENEGSRPRADHICMDFEKLLKVGVNGLISEITEKRKTLFKTEADFYDFTQVEADEFYECMLIELSAVLRLQKRYEEHLRKLALAEDADGKRKNELLRMADNLARVPANPPESFYEAVQSVHFFIFNLFGLYPLGRPDRYLYRFYKKDIESGVLTHAEAQEIIDNLCLLVSTYISSRAACGFIVGGSDKNGEAFENELTYMFITALNHIKMPDPNGAIACGLKTSPELLSYAVRVVGEGTTHPAFYNDSEIIKGLVASGVKPEEACEFIHSTCAEISVCGSSRMYTTSTTTSLPAVLEEALKGVNPRSTDEIIDRVFELIREALHQGSLRYCRRILEGSRNGHQPQRVSALINDCIERGKDVYSGGARYSALQPIFIGFANLCDSLMAIKRLVFDEKKLTLSEFMEAVHCNYEGSEELRRYILKKIPHYGNDNSEVDSIAKILTDRLGKMFEDGDFFGRSFSMPGTFSYINHSSIGSRFGAGYDGRLSGTSFSDGCCPVQGMDKNGPTAMINSLTSFDESRFLGGMVVNVKFEKSMFDEKKRELLVSMIKTFIERGGIEMQINCVDRKTLEDARLHPENHGDLIVRIGGYSDYFVRQSVAEQQELIDRSEY